MKITKQISEEEFVIDLSEDKKEKGVHLIIAHDYIRLTGQSLMFAKQLESKSLEDLRKELDLI